MDAKMDARFVALDHRLDRIEARFDRFEPEILAKVDRALRNQTWLMISALVALMGFALSIRL